MSLHQPPAWDPDCIANQEESSLESLDHHDPWRIHGAGIYIYMLTWLGYIDGIHVTIYSIHGSYGWSPSGSLKIFWPKPKTRKHTKTTGCRLRFPPISKFCCAAPCHFSKMAFLGWGWASFLAEQRRHLMQISFESNAKCWLKRFGMWITT